jgi:uncharacterized protein
MPLHDIALAACILLGAMLYTSVGHAGASAYIALMALFGVSAATMRPTALVLNIIVAALASVRYLKAGFFRFRLLWPFAITAIPCAYLGGMVHLPSEIYRPMLGIILWLSALRLLWPLKAKTVQDITDPPIPIALLAGALIGFLSGLTGTGGGIFLSPLLLFFAWSLPKPASGVVAVFILLNSTSGLLGNLSSLEQIPETLPLFAGAALVGAFIGTTFGIRLETKIITNLLAVVLLIAGAKMIGVY